MAVGRLTEEEVFRMADDVHAKILAHTALIAVAKGRITIEVFRNGKGFDVNLTITT